MGKHRHSKDKMFITYTELKEEWGGKKQHKRLPFSKLPFYCCSLSLSPFETPMCTVEGHVFQMLCIIPFLKKYGKSPVTGEPLKVSELIKMNWTKNEKGDYEDPISYKVFTEYTKIVCIRTSGNVYAYDTIEQLNRKPKFYFDLVSNEPFTMKDVIVIQDPMDARLREVESFDFVKKNLEFEPEEKLQPKVEQSLTMKRVMEEAGEKKKHKDEEKQKDLEVKKKLKLEKESREDMRGFIEWCMENQIYKHQRFLDMNGASLTSTRFTPSSSGKSGFKDLREDEVRKKVYDEVTRLKMKGYVQMVTNRGVICFVVHCDLTPKTGENFLELCESGYYDGCQFHRLVKDFCLQGGDPSGTGSGGQSIFGKVFEDQFHKQLSHNKAGILSMANSGINTNSSQFFVTLSSCPQLDNKHTVFGEVTMGESILYHINKTCASSKHEKPKEDVFIQKMHCVENPYRKVIQKLKEAYRKGHSDFEEFEKLKEGQRWIEEEEAFRLPVVREEGRGRGGLSAQVLSGYM